MTVMGELRKKGLMPVVGIIFIHTAQDYVMGVQIKAKPCVR